MSSRRGPISIPASIAALLGILDWAIFRPAIMSADSVKQYTEAMTQRYFDWHPAIMSIIVHWSFPFGGLAALTLIQSVAGMLGIYMLAYVLIAPKKAVESGSSGPHQWYALGVLLLLLLPISPLAFYLMTFLGDAWVAIAFIWISTLTILISRRSVWDRKAILCAIAAAVLVAFCTMVKHNVVAILPLFCILLYVAVPSRATIRAGVAALAVAVFVITTMALPKLYPVRHNYAENAIMALDLVGMCVESSAICEKLPYTSQHLNKDVYRRVYDFGNINQLIFVPPLVADDAYLNLTHDESVLGPAPELRAEFYSAIRRFPVAFTRVKIKGFLPLLSFDSWMWLPTGIKANPYGLHPNGWTGVADAFTRAELKARANRILRLPFAGHLPWLLLCIGLLIYFGMRQQWVIALVLLVMIGYYFSYLAATPSHDFRYMYPASLVVQVMAASLAARGLWGRSKNEAPSRNYATKID